MDMQILIERDVRTERFTLGKLSIDGVFECFTLEDVVRPDGEKIHGETAIPAGRYRLTVTYSPRFGRRLPLLIGVTGFDGIRFHPGNTISDTEGCVLPGRTRDEAAGTVGESRIAFNALFDKIDAADRGGVYIWCEVR